VDRGARRFLRSGPAQRVLTVAAGAPAGPRDDFRVEVTIDVEADAALARI
jgi:hypothetical protein